MSASPSIKPPQSFAEALIPISFLSEDEFARLTNAIAGPRSFSLSKEEIEELKKEIKPLAGVLPFTLGTLAYLYSKVSDLLQSDVGSEDKIVDQFVTEVSKDADWDDSTKEIMLVRLKNLLSLKDSHQRFKKVQRLQDGFLPNAVGFSSFIDLRPEFDEDESTRVKGFLSVVQFRVSTDSDNSLMKSLVFQMDERALIELKRAVDRAHQKMMALNADAALSSRLIKI